MPLYSTTFQSSCVRIYRREDMGSEQTKFTMEHRLANTAESRRAVCSYLEDSDDGPQQGVKVLPVRHGVARLRLQAELTAKDVHPQDTATQHKKRLQTEHRLWFYPGESRMCA